MMTDADSKPRLLIIIPNRGMGGAQRAFHDHSVALSEYYQVTVVIFNEDEADFYPSGNSVRSLNVPGGGSPVVKMQNFWQRVRSFRSVWKDANEIGSWRILSCVTGLSIRPTIYDDFGDIFVIKINE